MFGTVIGKITLGFIILDEISDFAEIRCEFFGAALREKIMF